MKRNAAYGHTCPSGYFTEASGFTLIELLVVIALIVVMLALSAPVTRDVLTVNSLKKASRQLIGLERKLRGDAVRDQVDYILMIDIPGVSYYVITSDMTPEKKQEIKKSAKKFPAGVAVLDIINPKNEKVADGEVAVKFRRNGVCTPLVLHLGDDEDRMTLAVNPFLGVTAVYDRYVDISMDSGLGGAAAK